MQLVCVCVRGLDSYHFVRNLMNMEDSWPLYNSACKLFCFIAVKLALWSPAFCKNDGVLLTEVWLESELVQTLPSPKHLD